MEDNKETYDQELVELKSRLADKNNETLTLKNALASYEEFLLKTIE